MKQFLASLMMLGLFSTADAGFVDEFTGGAPQQAWTFGVPPASGTFSDTYSALNGGFLQLGSGSVPPAGAGAAFGFVSENFGPQGVLVRANLNPNGATLSRDIGILANLNPQTLSGYALTIDYIDGAADLAKITTGAPENLVGAFTIPNFNAASSYDVELEIVGGNVIGRVYDSGNNLLTTLQAADTDYMSGFAGVVVNRESDDPPISGTFGRVSAAVPEPGSIGLLTGMALFATGARRRRRVTVAVS